MSTILCHHTHTTDSNETEHNISGQTYRNHHADYVSMVGTAPPDLNLIFTRTEHWQADPARFDRLANRVYKRGGTVDRFESHVVFKMAGSCGAVINGIETSLQTEDSHITVCGLPIEHRPPARVCSLDELCDLGREAAWVAPAHPRFPKLGFPDSRLRSLLNRVSNEPFDVALGYMTGYPALLNALARGKHTAHPISAYAQEYEIPLLPELDWHTALPRTPTGFGVVDDRAFVSLSNGEIPTTQLLAAKPIKTGRWFAGMRWLDFFRTFPGAVPAPFRSIFGMISPTEDSLQYVRDQTISELFAHPFWKEF